jgi:hypothetical protein
MWGWRSLSAGLYCYGYAQPASSAYDDYYEAAVRLLDPIKKENLRLVIQSSPAVIKTMCSN